MDREFKNRAKKLFTPSLVGIIALILISVAFLIFKSGGKNHIKRPTASMLARTKPSPPPQINQNSANNSYHKIVDMVRPAVVGISLQGSQGFIQAWKPTGTPPSLQAWGQGPSGLRANCPLCGTLATRSPGTPWQKITCPGCGNLMFCPTTQGPVQPQAWKPSGTPSAQTNTSTVNRREEYLQCSNCDVKIDKLPGIPWTGAICPNCKTVMAHIIRENTVTNNSAKGQPQAWGQGPSGLKANCPLCGTLATRSQGTPWQNVPCPGCGNLMFCPTIKISGQPQALQQPAPTRMTSNSLGAGIIVSRRGYILTSYNLVLGNNNVIVTLFSANGTQTLAGIVESVSPTDNLAIIKINDTIPLNLPVATLGNSDTVNVGEPVLAMGNPFGLAQTVSGGIISAKRRSVLIDGYQFNNVIQTDATINQGNAGGPLINGSGEVIGINIASYSPMQTSTGLGFAIPINRAIAALSNYIDNPQTQPAALRRPYCPPYVAGAGNIGAPRPRYNAPLASPAAAVRQPAVNEDSPVWIGAEIQLLNDILAEQMKSPFDSGILVNNVFPNSPASAAGLKRGDIIYRVDGRRITDETKLRLFLADKKPGDTVKMVVFRNGKKINITLNLAGGSWQQAALNAAPKTTDLLQGSEIEAGTADIVSLGLTVDKISPSVAFAFSLPENTTGVVIAEVEGLALAAGVKEGDIIASVDNQPTPDLISFFKSLKKCNLADGVDMGLIRNGKLIHIIVKEKPLPLIRGL